MPIVTKTAFSLEPIDLAILKVAVDQLQSEVLVGNKSAGLRMILREWAALKGIQVIPPVTEPLPSEEIQS